MLLARKDIQEELKKVKKEATDLYERIFFGLKFTQLDEKDVVNKFLSNKSSLLQKTSLFAMQIFDKYGFADPKRFGKDVSYYFWLFIFFADEKIFKTFRKRYLAELQKNLKLFPFLRPNYAYLFDKIAFLEGGDPRYFVFDNSSAQPENLIEINERRRAMSLPELSNSGDKEVKQSKKVAFIFTGIPGCGKNTQAELQKKKNNIDFLDSGSLIGEYIKNNQNDNLLASYQHGPALATDVLLHVLSEGIGKFQDKNRIIINSKPNSIEEFEKVKNLLENFGFELGKVFLLKINRETAIKRVEERLGDKYDEREPNYKKMVERVDNFIATAPKILEYIQNLGLLYEVDGSANIESIYETITSEIQKYK